jgi:hypothetical protein
MLDLDRNPRARCYDLGYDEGTISIRMPATVGKQLRHKLIVAMPSIEYQEEAFAAQSIAVGDFGFDGDRLGFGEVLQVSEEGDEAVWSVELPMAKDGDQTPLIRVSASLEQVLKVLMAVEPQDGASQQLLVAEVHVVPTMHLGGYPIGGRISAGMSGWMKERLGKGHTLPVLEAIMQEAWESMWPAFVGSNFRALLNREGCLVLGCPGNDTGLGLDLSGAPPDAGAGYRLTSHNVDGPLAQLTLLAGIARLNQMARQDLG